MKASLFTDDAPGQLVEAAINEQSDWAFVPLPIQDVEIVLDQDLWEGLANAKADVARLDGAGRYLPNPDLLLRPLQRREALTSSSLEGTFATPEQLLLYGLEPKEPVSSQDPANSWREVFNYGAAISFGQAEIDAGRPVGLFLIRQLHEILLRGVRGRDKTPGSFRRDQVFIGSDRRFIPPPPIQMDECLSSFERFIEGDSRRDPLIKAMLAHYQFETIHPFLDGNGRIGRAVLSLMIYKWCGLQKPWLFLSPFFERFKDEYINNLFRVSTHGDWKSWLLFSLRGASEQALDSTDRVDRLVALRADYVGRVKSGSVRLSQIIESLFGEPIVQPARLAEQYSVTYPTARSDIDQLQKVNILRELKNAYPMSFYAPEIMSIAYE